ncbi:hypothetical protein [Lysobacter gummosus]|uniref:hypothetical protein n=1 Tax=Lysobacter gummosus TaxID=262324 RepID=UPI003627AF46
MRPLSLIVAGQCHSPPARRHPARYAAIIGNVTGLAQSGDSPDRSRPIQPSRSKVASSASRQSGTLSPYSARRWPLSSTE